MGVTNWVLSTPPRLCQRQLYGNAAPMYTCLATAAEMVVKWENPYASFLRPRLESYLRGAALDSRARYLSVALELFLAWGFEAQSDGAYGTWSPEAVASMLRDKGPLVCIGDFAEHRSRRAPGSGTNGPESGTGEPPSGSRTHAITVYGYVQRFGGVHYIDPWDAQAKQISLHWFRQRVWRSYHSVYASKSVSRGRSLEDLESGDTPLI